MGKLEGKVAVITGGSSGMALASASCSSRKARTSSSPAGGRKRWTRPWSSIGRNVTGVQGDAANLDDLDRLFETVKREKGSIDVLFASAGMGKAQKIGEITERTSTSSSG